MRILFLSRRYFPAVSGMSVYARNMTRALAARGHELAMISQYREDEAGVAVYGGGPPPEEPWMEVHGLRSVGEERGATDGAADWERDIRDMVDLATELHLERAFDLVHAQYCYPTGLAALEVSRRLGIPNAVSIQGGDGHWVGPCCATHQRAMDAVLGHADALLIGCASFRQEVMDQHGYPAERFTIVPGATDPARFAPPGLLGRVGRPARLLYHGRVDARKGSLDFVRAGRRLIGAGHNVRLVVSGIGPDLDATRALAEELGIGDCVDFEGAAAYDEAHRRYRLGDVFVSPTYAEGFSNTILEAMAAGLPIVSTATVGVVDAIEHDVNGLLVGPGDVDALTRELTRVLTDERLRRRLAGRARTDVCAKYSWPVVAEQIERVYAEVCSGAPSEHAWATLCDVRAAKWQDADLSCRFRAEPHLL